MSKFSEIWSNFGDFCWYLTRFHQYLTIFHQNLTRFHQNSTIDTFSPNHDTFYPTPIFSIISLFHFHLLSDLVSMKMWATQVSEKYMMNHYAGNLIRNLMMMMMMMILFGDNFSWNFIKWTHWCDTQISWRHICVSHQLILNIYNIV